MQQNPQKAKLELLRHWTRKNFTNSVMFALTGLEDSLNGQYVEMAYDLVTPELSMEHNQLKPSKILTALAFQRELSEKDYKKIIKLSQEAQPYQIKEFLFQDVDHQPVEKVIDYMTFPVLAMMVSNLRPEEKADVLLKKPEIIHQTICEIRSKTLTELLTKEDVSWLRQKVPKELAKDLEIQPVPSNWTVISKSKTKIGTAVRVVNARFAQAEKHWDDVIQKHKLATQTGASRQIALWKQRRNIKD